MKLLFDEMLGNLASWCRILGIDSAYASGRSDTAILHEAASGGRMLVTRDAELAKRCARGGGACILLREAPLEAQIAQVIRESGAKATYPHRTRCASCNGELRPAGKDEVVAGVPEGVRDMQAEFWRCTSCGKVFWEGGHWRNIGRVYARVEMLLRTS